jgi:hypothetical protein
MYLLKSRWGTTWTVTWQRHNTSTPTRLKKTRQQEQIVPRLTTIDTTSCPQGVAQQLPTVLSRRAYMVIHAHIDKTTTTGRSVPRQSACHTGYASSSPLPSQSKSTISIKWHTCQDHALKKRPRIYRHAHSSIQPLRIPITQINTSPKRGRKEKKRRTNSTHARPPRPAHSASSTRP